MKLVRLDAGRLDEARQAFVTDGAVLLTGVPVQDNEALIGICSRFGMVTRRGNGPPPGMLIRELHWCPGDGEAAPLPPHTDSAFTEYPHAAMALACVTAAKEGVGESILIGVDDAVAKLDADDARALLSSLVTFTKRRDGAVQEAWTAPVLAERSGRLTIRYHPDHADAATADTAISGALDRLARALDDAAAQVRVHLAAGDLLVLDNLRALHGRTTINGSSVRHLRRLKMLSPAEQT